MANLFSTVRVAFGLNPDRVDTPPIDDEEFDHIPIEAIDPDDIETGDVVSVDSMQYDTCWIPDLVTRQEADYLIGLHPNQFQVNEPSHHSSYQVRDDYYFDQYELTYLGPTNARYLSADQAFVIQVMEELLAFRSEHNASNADLTATEREITQLKKRKSEDDMYRDHEYSNLQNQSCVGGGIEFKIGESDDGRIHNSITDSTDHSDNNGDYDIDNLYEPRVGFITMNFRVTESERDYITDYFSAYEQIYSTPSLSELRPNQIRYKLYFEGFTNRRFAERNQAVIEMIRNIIREYRQFGPPNVISNSDEEDEADNQGGKPSGGSINMAKVTTPILKKTPESHQ